MKKQLSILFVFTASVVLARPVPVTTETFSTLDREVAGIMDVWMGLVEQRSDESSGLFAAGTAVLRAEAALENALNCETDALPPEVLSSWITYLKSSTDCISTFRKAISSPGTSSFEETLLASFARWETNGGKFIESVQSTR
jgi:hypothetical protein